MNCTNRCHWLDDESIEKLVISCPDLTSLNLSDCSRLTDEAVASIAKYCPGLLELNISGRLLVVSEIQQKVWNEI